MANVVINKGQFKIVDKYFTGDVFIAILLDNTYNPDVDADEFYSDIIAKELPTGNGYTAGGITLSGLVVSEDDANNRARAVWSDVVWTAVGSFGPTQHAAIINFTTAVAATSEVIQIIDFLTLRTPTDEPFTLVTPEYRQQAA